MQFLREFANLSQAQQDRFVIAMKQMVSDLRASRIVRPGLRMKGVKGHPGIFEMSWAPNGRATFRYGQSKRPGQRHIIWRRIGGYEIFKNP